MWLFPTVCDVTVPEAIPGISNPKCVQVSEGKGGFVQCVLLTIFRNPQP